MQIIERLSNLLLIKKLSLFFSQKKYECLLFSFMLLMFGNTFSEQNRFLLLPPFIKIL